jgi:hypothetical protein
MGVRSLVRNAVLGNYRLAFKLVNAETIKRRL